MPQRKQPKSLYSLCINQAQVLIKTYSESIGDSFGDYDNPRSTIAIQQVQQHLLSVVDGFYLDKIFDSYRESFFHSLKYTGIFYSICFHENLTRMTRPNDALYYEPSAAKDYHEWSKKSIVDFWKVHLPRLTQLKELNLCRFCDCSVLQVVGQYCLKLEVLVVDFKISDTEYKCLVDCKNLKALHVSGLHRKRIRNEAAESLVRSLPKLELVSYCFLGDLLVSMDDVTSLRLDAVTQMNAKPNHIAAVARLCPNIKKLELWNNSEEKDSGTATTLTALAESDIRVPILALSEFRFGPEMKHLLTQKGIFITELFLDTKTDDMTVSDIKFIGNTCPNLKSLELHADKITSDDSGDITASPTRFFNLLESLKIVAKDCHYMVMPVILSHALNIKDITLKNTTGTPEADEEFDEYDGVDEDDGVDENNGVEDNQMADFEISLAERLMLHNPFSELRSVTLYRKKITIRALEMLVKRCPKLCNFTTDQNISRLGTRFSNLCRRVIEENLDLELVVVKIVTYYSIL